MESAVTTLLQLTAVCGEMPLVNSMEANMLLTLEVLSKEITSKFMNLDMEASTKEEKQGLILITMLIRNVSARRK